MVRHLQIPIHARQIPTLASCSLDEMLDAALPGQTQWLQLYVNSNRALTQKIIEKAESRGVKALFITVDAPQLGRREKDMRMKFDDPGSKVQETNVVERGQGAARAISSFIDSSLSWEDLAWFKTVTKLPILLKGVQCYEVSVSHRDLRVSLRVSQEKLTAAIDQDVLLAIKAGMQGVVLSNHGGRQLVCAGKTTSQRTFGSAADCFRCCSGIRSVRYRGPGRSRFRA